MIRRRKSRQDRHQGGARASLDYQATSSNLPAITGYAAKFYKENDPGTQYQLWPGAYERVMPGAFASVFKRRDDVRGLFNHAPARCWTGQPQQR
ncbi:MAG: HK97 family phage prohead protease [Planctomycetales bacterium]|nr:HK97 family phage prohead protease [Planctomycetales bacterium]